MPTNPFSRIASQAMGRVPAPAAGIAGTNAFGVPVLAPRVLAVRRPARAAGDAIDDIFSQIQSDPGFSPSTSDIVNAASSDVPGLDLSGVGGDLSANQLTDRQRERIAQQNSQIIGMATTAVNRTADVITSAITSGNEVEIARINADARVAVARLATEAAAAARRGDTASAQRSADQAAAADRLAQLTAALSGQRDNTMKYVLIGAAVLAVAGGAYFLTRGGRARRNPSPESGWPHYNPVMERRRKGKRSRAYFKPSEVGRARRRGWRKAR